MGTGFNKTPISTAERKDLTPAQFKERGDYYQQLSRAEKALFAKIPQLQADKSKYQEAFELLCGVRQLIGLLEAEKVDKPFHCHECKDNAMYMNFKLNKGYCFSHWNYKRMTADEVDKMRGKG